MPTLNRNVPLHHVYDTTGQAPVANSKLQGLQMMTSRSKLPSSNIQTHTYT